MSVNHSDDALESRSEANFHNNYIYTGEDSASKEPASDLERAEYMYLEGDFEQAGRFFAQAAAGGNDEENCMRAARGCVYCDAAAKGFESGLERCLHFLESFPNAVEAKSTWLYFKVLCSVDEHNFKVSSSEKLKNSSNKVYGSNWNVNDPVLLAERIFILYRSGQTGKAIDALDFWTAKFGNDADWCQFLGEVLCNLGRGDKAFKFLQVGARRGLERARLWYLHALAAALSGNFELARNSAAKAKRTRCTLPFMKDLDSRIDTLQEESGVALIDRLKNIFMPWK